MSAEVLHHAIHTAHCLERVHSEHCTFWHDDRLSADAALAAGFGLVEEASAAAWYEGHERGFWNGRMSKATIPHDAHIPLGKRDAAASNPYRPTPRQIKEGTL